MPKNVMKFLKPSPNHGRNDFDLSHRHLFPANFGELIPGTCIETVPGDKISLRVSDLVRAQPMVTSPYLRAKQHVDVWFVPYQLMWSKFNEFVVDKDEPSSSSTKNRLFLPHTDLSSLAVSIQDYDAGNVTDIHGANPIRQITRNLDLLGYCGNLLDGANHGTLQYANKKVNLWRLLAYNLIWYREYRQQYYDDGKYLLPSSMANQAAGAAYLFNMDFLNCGTEAQAFLNSGDPDLSALLTCLIQPRYRCWKKDLFTGLMPSTQFGNVSLVSLDSLGSGWITSPSPTAGSYTVESYANGLGEADLHLQGTSPVSYLQPKSTGSFDILALRKSEAVQKWRERSLMAGNQVQDNFEAHYGEKPASHMDVHPRHVASFDAPLNIGDIMATADTGTGVNRFVGDVAGKGIMSFDGSQEIRFETSDFGVMMVIYSILPEAEYNANQVDRLNALLEREDYFFPEYENLGLEAVDKSVITDNTNSVGVVGYAPRYFGYKQKLDRVCGDFMKFQGFSGQFAPWASPKFDVDAISGGLPIPLSTLYVNPAVFNNNFHANYNVVDQFLVDFYSDVEAFRKMSVSGMPGY